MIVTSDRFDSEHRSGLRVTIPTPEGVPLVFTLASIGERAYAFTLDALFASVWFVVIILFLLLAFIGSSHVLFAVALLAFFLLRNGWFLGHELRGRGRTPGKRRAELRVIDASGGALQPHSIVVRNLTREIELFVPIMVLSNPGMVVTSGTGLAQALAVLWVLALALVPFFDRHRRRIGDLLAGTIVVREPRVSLVEDLLSVTPADPGESLVFDSMQLSKYGVYELQVLETILRERRTPSATLELVAQRVCKKIDWTVPLAEVGGARVFLEAFYRAQRARLEHDLTLGRARERKEGAEVIAAHSKPPPKKR